MTVKQLIKGLKKYHRNLEVVHGVEGTAIKAMRIWSRNPKIGYDHEELVVRLIRQDEKRT